MNVLYYFQPVAFSVAKCIALWGDPEQAVAWRREEQQSGWSLLLHLCDWGKAEHVHVHVACVHTHLYGHTSTGFDYLSSCTSKHALLYLLSWAYSVCVLLLCCFSSEAHSVCLCPLPPLLKIFPNKTVKVSWLFYEWAGLGWLPVTGCSLSAFHAWLQQVVAEQPYHRCPNYRTANNTYFPQTKQHALKGKCCNLGNVTLNYWMLPLVTPCHTHYHHLYPFHF